MSLGGLEGFLKDFLEKKFACVIIIAYVSRTNEDEEDNGVREITGEFSIPIILLRIISIPRKMMSSK